MNKKTKLGGTAIPRHGADGLLGAQPESQINADPVSASMMAFQTPEINNYLRDLEDQLTQCRVAFLMGAGCSKCAGLPLMNELTSRVQKSLPVPSLDVLNAVLEGFEGSPRSTIEDFMSEIVDLVAIAERRKLRNASSPTVNVAGRTFTSEILGTALDDVKREIAKAIANPQVDLQVETHRLFIRTLHRTLRSGRTSTFRHAVDYFTLNYDTLIEDALSLERVPTIDGFQGGATGWWDVKLYQEASASARVYKLHGSIDWCLCDDDILPRRIRAGVAVSSRKDHLMIWPAATKYRETQRDPYAQLVSLMRRSLRPDTTDIVVCICGYAFADDHINFELDRALRESNGRLTFVVFTSDDEPRGQLKLWNEDPQLAERVRIHANRGFYHANIAYTTAHELPWWKFEVLTQILAGHR
ncbi:SIR2 family protein [Planctomicrobium sp. SH664]|uniref:SIR2 family protein n=1 Tax=Planctomicrobium sp. SH664 TaxID=3448125 RepID=UPI003F5B7043